MIMVQYTSHSVASDMLLKCVSHNIDNLKIYTCVRLYQQCTFKIKVNVPSFQIKLAFEAIFVSNILFSITLGVSNFTPLVDWYLTRRVQHRFGYITPCGVETLTKIIKYNYAKQT